jgi:hypothetical protein
MCVCVSHQSTFRMAEPILIVIRCAADISFFLSFFLSVSMALQPFGPWPFSQFRNPIQSLGLLGRGISASQGRYLHTGQHKHDIHASSGIRTHDPSVRMGEEGSCLRPRNHCDRLYGLSTYTKPMRIIQSEQKLAFFLSFYGLDSMSSSLLVERIRMGIGTS